VKHNSILYLLAILVLALGGCSPVVATRSPGPASTAPEWGVQTRTAGCKVHAALQDTACTPGAIFQSATRAKICTPGYAKSVRNVATSLKNKVYAEYGITRHVPGQYEIDHLVSLQLGGSNDISNLWPEKASPKPGFHEKDRVENYLHDQICSRAITVQQAQIEIATNWLAVYTAMPKNTPGGTNTGGSP
jgi:hypothetical protein